MHFKLHFHEVSLAEAHGEAITTPELLFHSVVSEFQPFQEDMFLLVLNTKNRIIQRHLIGRGSSSSMVLAPADLYKRVLLSNGTSFAICHSHPSGDVTPSEEDIIFTQRVKKGAEILGLKFIDHLVFSASEHYSFRKHGLL